MKKLFYLFSERGITDRFFCGNVYEALPTDEIIYHGCSMTFGDCEADGYCKVFNSRKEANTFSLQEENDMQESNDYAQEAMYAEEKYIY